MRIAIDMMGGDYAPTALIDGTVSAAKLHAEDHFILVGREEALANYSVLPDNVSLVKATEVMAMDENVSNFITKKDSSIWVATRLVRDGEADAVISAGSTGAQMTAAVALLGRIKNVTRPAISLTVPKLNGRSILLDVGANADCTPEMLVQFAQMGAVYAAFALDKHDPRVALLSNGTEEHKGNDLVKQAHVLLSEAPVNFIGNLEARDVLSGDYDVMVCDGFSGNIIIKSIEGTVTVLMKIMKEELTASAARKLGAALIKPGLKNLKAALDYKEYGGAPLLGVKGISIVCHGSSDARAIMASIEQARLCHAQNFVEKMREAMHSS